MDELTYAYVAEIDLTKSADTADGDLLVYGKATGPDLDLDGHRCDPKWLQKAMPAWMEWGNVREQHSAIAAGVGVELAQEGNDWYVKALVVDKNTAEKVRKRVLKGFSIGIHGARLVKDANGQLWIVDGIIPELSLVDRPNNPTTKMAICKAAGGQMRPVDGEGEPLGDDPASFVEGEDVLDEETTLPVPADKTIQPTLPLPGATPPAPPAGLAQGGVVPAKVKPARDANLLSARAFKAAVALVDKALATDLTKAVDESSDIAGAWAAIGQICDLIISEATELKGGRMEEKYDIELLCRAICALECFLNREAMQQAGSYGPDTGDDDAEDVSYVQLMAKFVSADQRRRYGKSGVAMPNGDFPIPDEDHLRSAVGRLGKYTGDKGAAKAHIIKRARALGLSNLLPDGWSTGGGDGKKGKKTKAAGSDGPQTSTTDVVDIPEIVKQAVAEATAGLRAQLDAAQADLAKVAATPIPGGPVLITGAPTAAPAASQQQAEAARLRATAAQANDPTVRTAYLDAARRAESAAKN